MDISFSSHSQDLIYCNLPHAVQQEELSHKFTTLVFHMLISGESWHFSCTVSRRAIYKLLHVLVNTTLTYPDSWNDPFTQLTSTLLSSSLNECTLWNAQYLSSWFVGNQWAQPWSDQFHHTFSIDFKMKNLKPLKRPKSGQITQSLSDHISFEVRDIVLLGPFAISIRW